MMDRRLIMSIGLIILFWIILYALGNSIREAVVYLIGCGAVGWHMNSVSDWILGKFGK